MRRLPPSTGRQPAGQPSSSSSSASAPTASFSRVSRAVSLRPVPRISSPSPSSPARSRNGSRAVSAERLSAGYSSSPQFDYSNVTGKQLDSLALRVLSSDLLSRSRFADKFGLSFDDGTGFKRDLWKALGYPSSLTIADYRSRYERGDISERIIEAYPRGTWSGGADIQEDEDVEIRTQFELDIYSLITRLKIWSKLKSADILAGLGHYSVLLIGTSLPGKLDVELPKLISPNPDTVIHLTAYAEDRAKIDKLETNPSSPRFGLPLLYEIDLGTDLISADISRTRVKTTNRVKVHWSRVIHIAEGLLENDIYGKPRLRSVWNKLMDIDKVSGGGSEAAWRRMDPGLHVDIDADAELDPDEENAISDEVDEYLHNLRRTIRTRGARINPLTANVINFGPNVDSLLKFISGTTSIPIRILVGSERGELASTQDRDNWHDAIDDRREDFGEPLIRQLVDRFIEYGIVSAPSQYQVIWPSIDTSTEDDKAGIIGKIAKANKDQVESGDGPILTSNEIRDRILHLDPLEESGIDSGNIDDEPSSLRFSLRSNFTLTDFPPDHADWIASHRAAERNISSLATTIEDIWVSNVRSVKLSDLEKAIESGYSNTINLLEDVFESIETDIYEQVSTVLLSTLVTSAKLTLKGAKSRGTFLRSAGSSNRSLVDITLTFDVDNPRAIDWAALRSSQLIKEISPETRLAIQQLITSGIDSGIAPRKLAQQIRQIVGLRSDQLQAVNNLVSRLSRAKPGYIVQAGNKSITIPKSGASQSFIDKHLSSYAERLRKQRAVLIARTETLNAANQGQRELWKQASEAGQISPNQLRVWIVTPDERLRDSHAAMEGLLAPIDRPFITPDGRELEPGQEPNCRCGQGLSSETSIVN